MSKIGIGIGEEFPVDDAKAPPNPPGHPDGNEPGRRHWRGHFILHVLARVVLIALVIAAIVWMFSPHYFYPGPYAHVPPYGYYPYAHHFFFFPFFPLLLIALFAFAWRRGRCYGYHRYRDDHRRGHYHEEA